MELHLNIMVQMDRDPVSQVCFGLANRYFYSIYHMAKDKFLPNGTRWYPVRSYPLDLRMQISICGQHMWHGWNPWLHLDRESSIKWHKSLGQLIGGERMWGDQWHCEGCSKHKPQEAFDSFEYENALKISSLNEFPTVMGKAWEHCVHHCRRCRAKVILIVFEKRDEWIEDQVAEEERTSLGLRKSNWRDLIGDEDPLRHKVTERTYLEIVGGMERWKEIFEKLGI